MLLEIVVAHRWHVLALVEARGRCPVKEALDTLSRTDQVAHAEIAARLDHLASCGAPWDERRSRHLGHGIFQLKTPRGVRVLYFFDRHRVIVCTALVRKPKPRVLRLLIARAQEVRDAYRAAVVTGTVVVEGGRDDHRL